jgi:hypothetical protein
MQRRMCDQERVQSRLFLSSMLSNQSPPKKRDSIPYDLADPDIGVEAHIAIGNSLLLYEPYERMSQILIRLKETIRPEWGNL